MNLTDITGYLRQAVPYTYVPNEFVAGNPDDCAYVRLTGGFPPSEWTSKRKPSFQVILRAKSTSVADSNANAIYAELNRKAEFYFGTQRIIKCVADQSSPIYLGKDENGRATYSLNFTVTTI
ncbi:minor capsid protein [Paenibacillus sp. ACRRX]|uniref:minor capsid protein n=1 Tax=Paenibacillus sp. ACRRX TaxID=2918206 RepID=UPI001EF576FF|nr:minor capsid protein [Paenibacillus sp. ACRRX]MCG7407693.1 minor capsid protein [Paenibacillus sp. ACRRX]